MIRKYNDVSMRSPVGRYPVIHLRETEHSGRKHDQRMRTAALRINHPHNDIAGLYRIMDFDRLDNPDRVWAGCRLI